MVLITGRGPQACGLLNVQKPHSCALVALKHSCKTSSGLPCFSPAAFRSSILPAEPSEQKKVLNRTIARKNRHVGTASSISYDGMLHTRYGPNKPAPPSPYVSQYHLKYNDGVSVHFDDRPPEKPKGAMRPSSAFEVNQQAVHNKHVSRNTSITLVQEMNPHHPRPSSANRSYYHGAFTTR